MNLQKKTNFYFVGTTKFSNFGEIKLHRIYDGRLYNI